MPLPFDLDHINLWLLDDAREGRSALALVDTGLGNAETRALHEQAFAAASRGRALARLVVTHYHPDHAGCAAWLVERHGAELWMTRSEFLTVHAARNGAAGYSIEQQLSLFRAHGMGEDAAQALRGRGNLYGKMVPAFPDSHRRVLEGEVLRIGGREWRAIVGYGHAPEHLSLYCEESNVLIAGDMLLPKISTNIAVRPVDPMSNPLQTFLDSIRRYRALPEDVLVLPSHGLPFRGAHARIAALEAHHAARLEALEAACRQAPRSAAEALDVLFPRRLDSNAIFFAMGEAIAHLNYLYYAGRVERRTGADGVVRFCA
ncbi:MAG: MBL fold metallo-hydrolase [Burkholderiales bacterium]|nr:MBL fold metallo-hydrolase [Burkholderiales bacterium]